MCSWKYSIKWYNEDTGEWIHENGITLAENFENAMKNIATVYGDLDIETFTLTCWDESYCVTTEEIREMFKNDAGQNLEQII